VRGLEEGVGQPRLLRILMGLKVEEEVGMGVSVILHRRVDRLVGLLLLVLVGEVLLGTERVQEEGKEELFI